MLESILKKPGRLDREQTTAETWDNQLSHFNSKTD